MSEALLFCEMSIACLMAKEEVAKMPAADRPVLRDLKNGLMLACLNGTSGTPVYIRQGHIKDAGITEEKLFEIGLHNLDAFARLRLRVRTYAGIYAVFMGGYLEAGALLLDWLWDEGITYTVKNTFVVAVPSTDVLSFCDSGDPDGIQKLRLVVEDMKGRAERPLSQTLYVRREGAWVPFEA